MTFRPLRAYRTISRDLDRSRADERAADQRARDEVARSARSFSHRSQKVVDETMTLSAVLMRAGEVEEANRLLAEVDREVCNERAALIETVVEAKVRKDMAHRRVTRLRLAKLVVTAVLGMSLMSASAFGLAVARYLAPETAEGATVEASTSGVASREIKDGLLPVHFAGMKIELTAKQLAEFERLTAKGDDALIEAFLRKVLSGKLADKVLGAASTVTKKVDDATNKAIALVADAKKEVKQASTSDSPHPSNDEQKDKDQSDDQQGSGHAGQENCDEEEEGETRTAADNPLEGCRLPVVNEESPL